MKPLDIVISVIINHGNDIQQHKTLRIAFIPICWKMSYIGKSETDRDKSLQIYFTANFFVTQIRL